jgi:hypothetical protein
LGEDEGDGGAEEGDCAGTKRSVRKRERKGGRESDAQRGFFSLKTRMTTPLWMTK